MRLYGPAFTKLSNQDFFAELTLRIGGAATPEHGLAIAGRRPARGNTEAMTGRNHGY